MLEFKINKIHNLFEQSMKGVGFGNTFRNLLIVDVFAIISAINNHTKGRAWIDGTLVTSKDNASVDIFLFIETNRVIMNSDNFVLGFEYFTMKLPIHEKKDFGVVGIPYNLNPYFIFLSQLKIAEINIEYPEINNSIQSNKEDCNYSPHDKKFAYDEIKKIISIAINFLPEIIFDPKERSWTMCNQKDIISNRREKIYSIENGDVFYGTLKEFEDCFFSNPDDESIKDWCEKNGYILKIEE